MNRQAIRLLARVGYSAKGAVYALVGLLALRAAKTWSRPAGSSEALEVLNHPLLLVIGLGLLAFSLWRLVQTVIDPDQHGTSWKGWIHRLGYALSGLVYFDLGKEALELLLERPEPEEQKHEEEMVATALTHPGGEWLVGLLGLAIVGMGLAQILKAFSSKFLQRLDLHKMSAAGRLWTGRLATIGLVARGLVFILVGVTVMGSAYTLDPQAVRTIEEVFGWVRRLDYGRALLAAVGAGFLCYGTLMAIEARYRSIGPLKT